MMEPGNAQCTWPTVSRGGVAIIALLLVLPLAVSTVPSGGGSTLVIDWPRVCSGDEPHYLLMVNSLICDGDLDLRNNYTGLSSASLQAGRSFAGRPLDHHTKWFEGSRLVTWGQGAASSEPPAHEYSWHPPGLPLLLAPLVWPLRGTPWVEPAALLSTAVVTIVGLAFFCILIRGYLAAGEAVWTAAAVAFLGTPLWPYARTLYTEPYLATCAIGAYALALRRSNYVLAGILLAIGMTMKPPFVLLALPLAGVILPRGGMIAACRFFVPMAIAVFWILGLNRWMHGSSWRSSIQWAPGDLGTGVAGLLCSRTHGLLPLVPAVLPVIAAWPTFLRRSPSEATALLTGCVLYFVLMANWVAWHGGACFGPRMIVPILPLLFTAAAVMPDCRWWAFKPLRGAAIGVCVLSIVFNGVAAFSHGQAWNNHPVDVLAKWFG
jgi:hypothetical protein